MADTNAARLVFSSVTNILIQAGRLSTTNMVVSSSINQRDGSSGRISALYCGVSVVSPNQRRTVR